MVTVMSTKPAAWAGEMAVIDVAELTVCEAAGVPLKLTVAPLTKLVPVIAIDVAPVVGPEVGLTAVTVGVTAL